MQERRATDNPARLDERIEALRKDVDDIGEAHTRALDNLREDLKEFVRLSRFRPVEVLVYSVGSLIAGALVTALVGKLFGVH